MKKYKMFKVFRPFLKPTADEKSPTDIKLDNEIHYVSDILHHLTPKLEWIIKTKIQRFFIYRWKYIFGRLFIVSLIVGVVYLGLRLANIEISSPKVTNIITSYPNDTTMNLRNFLLQISYIESRCNPEANRENSQYWGAYQIGTNERKLAGYGDIPKTIYMKHPEIQDLCMVGLMKYNRKVLKNYIKKYSGKIVGGILVTESGILAMSHQGVGNVMKYMDSNGRIIGEDANRTKCTDYLKLGGYKLNLDDVKVIH